MKKRRNIGLALGGGGARGLAHIGVMKVLEREGFKPDIIVGTSMGSLVGGLIATGLTTEEIEKKVISFLESDLYRSSSIKEIGDAERGVEQKLSKRIQNYFRSKIRMAHGIYRPSILQIEAIEELINYFIPDIQIEETLIPFRSVATDLKSGKAVILKNGPLRRSVLASSAVPGILPTVEIDGKQLSDGGIVHCVPASCAVEEGADLVIAVSVGRDLGLFTEFQTAVDIYARAAEIQGYYLEEFELRDADLLIKPHLGTTHWTDFSRKEELISQGEAAAAEKLPEIRDLIKSASRRELVGSVKRMFKGLFVSRKRGIW